MPLIQLGFVIERVTLAGRARHEQLNHPLGLRRVVQLLPALNVRDAKKFVRRTIAQQHRRQRDRRQAARLKQKIAAMNVGWWYRHTGSVGI